jgi:P pilus assembly chaperone PapD
MVTNPTPGDNPTLALTWFYLGESPHCPRVKCLDKPLLVSPPVSQVRAGDQELTRVGGLTGLTMCTMST